MNIWERLGQRGDGPADVFKAFSEILPAMSGDEDERRETRGVRRETCDGRRKCGGRLLDLGQGEEQGIDDGIACDDNGFRGNPLVEQIPAIGGGWGEMQGGEAGGQHPVEFLRPGGLQVSGAEPGLDMADGDMMVERRQGGGEDRRGIALNQDKVGFLLLQIAIQRRDGAGCEAGQGLVPLHEVEIHIRDNAENVENLVQHVTVLGRHAYPAADLRGFAEGQNHRGQFDGFRSCSENDGDGLFHVPKS